MDRIYKIIFLCFIFFSNSQSSFANETILKHALSVGQAMSAFYMKSLLNGDSRYDASFSQFKRDASQTIQKYESENGLHYKEFKERWQEISTEIKLEYSEGFGWDVPYKTRMSFRSYLSDIYQLINKQKTEYKSVNEKILFSSVQIESIAARFLDISSSYDGSVSLFDEDWDKLNPIKISTEFKHNTLIMMKNEDLGYIKKHLKNASIKWSFIDHLVTNYNSDAPYFLVYSTKNSIYKSLKKSISMSDTTSTN